MFFQDAKGKQVYISKGFNIWLFLYKAILCFFLGIGNLKKRIKNSLEMRYQDYLKHDWLEEGLNFPLMKYYTDLVWKRMVKEAMEKGKKPMTGIDELLKIPGAGKVCIKILVEGIVSTSL